jgi:hypothetical protein
VRKEIEPNYIDAGNVGILVEEPLTKLPMRNPMLSFMFFIDSAGLKMDDLGVFLNSRENQFLPNYIVLLDIGVIVNIDKKEYENGNIRINLYPGYELKENLWVLIEIPDSNNVLIYQYMLAIEHLNSSMVSIPDVRSYTSKLFNISFSDIHTL